MKKRLDESLEEEEKKVDIDLSIITIDKNGNLRLKDLTEEI